MNLRNVLLAAGVLATAVAGFLSWQWSRSDGQPIARVSARAPGASTHAQPVPVGVPPRAEALPPGLGASRAASRLETGSGTRSFAAPTQPISAGGAPTRVTLEVRTVETTLNSLERAKPFLERAGLSPEQAGKAIQIIAANFGTAASGDNLGSMPNRIKAQLEAALGQDAAATATEAVHCARLRNTLIAEVASQAAARGEPLSDDVADKLTAVCRKTQLFPQLPLPVDQETYQRMTRRDSATLAAAKPLLTPVQFTAFEQTLASRIKIKPN